MKKIIFSKFSYERLADFQTMTVIFKDKDSLIVKKQALTPQSKPHICSFAQKYEALNSYYTGKLSAVPCNMDKNGDVIFPVVKGASMESILTEILNKKDHLKAIELIKNYFEQIRMISSVMSIKNDKFTEIFGDYNLPDKMSAMAPANIDMTFDNVFLSDTNNYTVIDYEWTFDFPVPSEFVMYRALLHSRIISESENVTKEKIYALLNADKSLLDVFYNMELNFQRYVYGKGRVLSELYKRYGKQAYSIWQPAQFALSNGIQKAYETEAKERQESQKRAKELFDAYNSESRAREEAQKQAEEYRTAYDSESRAREEAQKQAEEYRIAYDSESRAREEAQKQAEKYHTAYDSESRAREKAQKQAEEYRTAYDSESRAREEAQKQAEEYRIAYDSESRAREEAQKQAEEYRIAYDSESRAREEAQKQAEEYYTAYKKETEIREKIESKLKGKR